MATYGELTEKLNAASARADLPVRVKLGNGEVRDLDPDAVELEEELEVTGEVEEATGEPQIVHRVIGIVLSLAPKG